jgi:hypothetical protein
MGINQQSTGASAVGGADLFAIASRREATGVQQLAVFITVRES